MAWLVFAYIALALVTGTKVLIDGNIAFGLTGAIAPIITLIGGAGILSAERGYASMNLGSIIVGVLMLAGGCFWLWFVDWKVVLHSIVLPGYLMGLIGFFLGLGFALSSSKEDRI